VNLHLHEAEVANNTTCVQYSAATKMRTFRDGGHNIPSDVLTMPCVHSTMAVCTADNCGRLCGECKHGGPHITSLFCDTTFVNQYSHWGKI